MDLIDKWRFDLKKKNINHVKLLQIILDESGYSSMLKNKKDLENENRLENIKELLSAMKEFDNLESFRACFFSNFNRSRLGRRKKLI